MSAEALPITPAAFAEAIKELTVPSLHAKAAELRNSIYHLRRSNLQLQPFADEGDGDCAEAIRENEEVMARMEDRIELLKLEVEVNRGMLWVDDAKADASKEQVNGDASEAQRNGDDGEQRSEEGSAQNQSATETQQQPANSASHVESEAQDEHEGVFL
ncbi:translation machinery-associated protein 17 [Diplodia corticola]|uniref:Translation machinery-associated protein 17 n=1 Tax=Diplodia corticola TaxID=236234 RepID=A0A1J9RDT4_9PEZI|nr:translation machinery-associated protein 17 [Diplodia corticola]OJD38601.1 translation machinery-associated protein 17 [Diplodia corticola]